MKLICLWIILFYAFYSHAETYKDLTIIPVSVDEEVLAYQPCYDRLEFIPMRIVFSSLKPNGSVDYFIGDPTVSDNIKNLDSIKSFVSRPNTCLESLENRNKICIGDEVLVDWVIGVGGITTGKVIGISRLPQKKWSLFSRKENNQILIQVNLANGYRFKTYNDINSISIVNSKNK